MKKILINIAYYLVLFFKYFYIYIHNFFTWFYNLLAKVFKWNVRFYYAQENAPADTTLNKIKAFFKTTTKDKNKMAIDYKQKFDECNKKGQKLFNEYNKELQKNKTTSQEIKKLKGEIQGLENYVAQLRSKKTKQKKPTPKSKDTRSALEILGLNSPTTQKEIKKAYTQLVNRYHPDKHIHMSDAFKIEVNNEFINIKNAYKFLKN